jgi:allophanate hydrolase subunit 2
MSNEFNQEQLEVINACKAKGYSILSFTPDIDALKMRLAYLAFKDGLDITPYLNSFNHDQLDEIRLGLVSGINISEYTDAALTAEDMHMKRLYLEDKYRLSN